MEIIAPVASIVDGPDVSHLDVGHSESRSELIYYNPFSETLTPSERYIKYSGDVLGKGAFKTVYKAFDLVTGREVAWNEVVLDTLEPMASSKLFQEIKALKDVSHNNIIKLYDHWFESTGVLVFTTELMPSGCLKKYLKKNPTALTTPVLKSWALQILEALHYMHTCQPKIIHRDIKAQNIFVNGATGVVKVGDLGLCASLGLQSTAVSCIGTPEFMAPETYSSTHYDEKVDIYAFGMLLLELITRDSPYLECTNIIDVLKKIEANIPPNGLNKVVHKEVKDLILMCINGKPSARPSAYDLLCMPFLRNMQDTGKLTTDSKDSTAPVQAQAAHPSASDAATLAATAAAHPVQTSLNLQAKHAQAQVQAGNQSASPQIPSRFVPPAVSMIHVQPQQQTQIHAQAQPFADVLFNEAHNSTLYMHKEAEVSSSVVIRRRPGKSSLCSDINIEITLPNQTSFVYVLSLADKPVDIVDELELIHDNVGAYRNELLLSLQQFLNENKIDRSLVQEAESGAVAQDMVDNYPNESVDEQFTSAMQALDGFLETHTGIADPSPV